MPIAINNCKADTHICTYGDVTDKNNIKETRHALTEGWYIPVWLTFHW